MKLFSVLRNRDTIHPQNTRRFLATMEDIAPKVGLGAYGFRNADNGGCYGFVQFIANSPQSVTIHRLWTLQPGQGNGGTVLRKVCDLADHHSVELTLKTLPFGRKPYPMSRDQLIAWYERHGFTRSGRKMIRKPSSSAMQVERAMGLEPNTNPDISRGNPHVSPVGAPKASPTPCPPVVADDDLRALMEAWPKLPTAMRAGILAMVKAGSQ